MIWKNISWNDAKILQHNNSYIFVDLRDYKEYEKEHFKGAINLPYFDVFSSEKRNSRVLLDIYFEGKIPVFYCERGGNSMLAARKCAAVGINAYSIIGGYERYRNK